MQKKFKKWPEKAITGQELELVHVEVVGSSKNSTVRIYIESEKGITHDDCSLVSRKVEELLDEDDPFENKYTLEVSSPGIERGLYNLKDFEKFADNLARLKLTQQLTDRETFVGKLSVLKIKMLCLTTKQMEK